MNNPAGGDTTALLFDQEGGVARLTLNRPAAANAIDMALARELMLAAILIATIRRCRCCAPRVSRLSVLAKAVGVSVRHVG